MGKLTETEVPPLPPELSQGGGTEGRRHDGFGFDAKALPQESDYLEGTEVKEQDQTKHADPPAQNGSSLRNGTCHSPEEDCPENRFERRPEPSRRSRRRYTLSP